MPWFLLEARWTILLLLFHLLSWALLLALLNRMTFAYSMVRPFATSLSYSEASLAAGLAAAVEEAGAGLSNTTVTDDDSLEILSDNGTRMICERSFRPSLITDLMSCS